MPDDSQTSFENKKILIVDDESDFTEMLEYHLRKEAFETKAINNPYLTLSHVHKFNPDLFVLDIMMPDLNGFQLCRMLRAIDQFEHTPIVFLTARNEVEDRVKAFEYGCDAYLNKPINITEFVLTIKAIFNRMNRLTEMAGRSKVVKVGPLVLDGDNRQVRLYDDRIELTPIQFKLLKCLMQNRGRIQSRDDLRAAIWPHLERLESRAIDVHIRRLREKLNDYGSLIETVRGIGYRVVE